MKKIKVGIIMGSDSDYPIMEETCKALEEFDVPHEITVTSAHRSPERTRKYVTSLRKRGVQVLIAAAGGAAHLAGVAAAETALPVIGVPIPSASLDGMDSLLSTVQMPGGIPVATVAIGKPGAKNAGLLAVRILALNDLALAKKLDAYIKSMAKQVDAKNKKLQAAHAKSRKT